MGQCLPLVEAPELMPTWNTAHRTAIRREHKEAFMFEGWKIAVPPIAASVEIAAPPPRRGRAKKLLVAMALMGTSVGAVIFGYACWADGRYLVSTDDAYVKVNYTTVAPKISGYIDRVLVEDDQSVKTGQVLARIDDRDFRTALDQTRADVDMAEAAIRNIAAEIDLQHAVIDQARAAIVADEASLAFARLDADRYRELAKIGAGTVQQAQQTDAFCRQTVAELDRDRAGLSVAEQKTAVLTTRREQALAQLDHMRAVLAQAVLNLSYTVIAAPVDGKVGARSLRVGEYVAAGTRLMAVVPLNAVYVVANFKEAQLTDMRDGQPAEVTVDSFPGRSVKAHVESLSPMGGVEFSLPQNNNATGDFTRIAQRIPVKIALDDPGMVGFLRPGMSVELTVNTRRTVVNRHRGPASYFQFEPDKPSAVASMMAAIRTGNPFAHEH
jgi:membrane fusion protein, multidrug efflux system